MYEFTAFAIKNKCSPSVSSNENLNYQLNIYRHMRNAKKAFRTMPIEIRNKYEIIRVKVIRYD